jgi:hypothetical protein
VLRHLLVPLGDHLVDELLRLDLVHVMVLLLGWVLLLLRMLGCHAHGRDVAVLLLRVLIHRGYLCWARNN